MSANTATRFNQINYQSRGDALVKGVKHYVKKIISKHLSGASSSPAGSINRDLN